jgi:plasmid stabilization system protein ParE
LRQWLSGAYGASSRTSRAWPASSRRASSRPGVRVVPLGRYPYKIFYRVTEDAVEILHIHHAAQQPWDEKTEPPPN